MDEAELKSVTESLYKQNLELAVKNKTLSLLSKLYDISLLALTPAELADKITDNIRTAFEFEMVAIFNYSYHRDRMFSLGLAESVRFHAAENDSMSSNNTVAIENVSKHSFFGPVLANRKMQSTENLKEVWGEGVSADRVKKIEEEGHVRSSVAYPLISEDKTIGVLVIELNRDYEKLATYEKESIESLTNVVAIALEKAILYEKLRITNEELEQANTRQEGLIHFISHQIKGYLTKSKAAFAGILEGDYGEASPVMSEMVKMALADNEEGVATIKSILDASNLKKGTTEYKRESFDLRKAVEEQITSHTKEAESKGLTLENNIDQKENYTFVGDVEQLGKHVVGNLIDNSVKYTLKGGLKIGLSKKDGKILFSVKDTGVGISDEDKKRLFTEGGRGKESIKVNVNSTGYGLFIAKQIVEAHGGKIWAESEGPGKGSTFFMELPTN